MSPIRPYSLAVLGALVGLSLGVSATARAAAIPAGWSCSGTCGSLGADGVVTLSPTGNSSYEYVSTYNAFSTTAVLPGKTQTSETDGSILTTSTFAATAGTALNFYFNFVTSDGSSTFADYAWAELFSSATNTPVALLFTGQTEPSGSIVPAQGLSAFPVGATLSPSSVPIISGGPTWSPLGSSSGLCFDAGCGYTGWVLSSYTIPTGGNYYLEFGATNWQDDAYDTGLAIDGVTVGGVSITPTVPTGPTPEPSTLALFGTGLIGFVSVMKRKVMSR
jgi:hypothetical protein